MHSSKMTQTVMPAAEARLAQPVERKALNLVVVGSSPTVGVTTKLCVCLPLLAFVISG